ncbi:BREX system P-loop protein BrxC [Anabaena sp. CS-542/02]|uniref:BREX system P-loop protein BrxC n=1 Tax=Anabaena sp. CS-542/02 TaxID=3021719 RepID=UPI00232B316F|nr:BREX system P-loop protein BrxC [Anabaena sp. CS-542/02]MDB9446892.1 BREX system P-loop protein BrxC [Anabaena sp. CS-542/02]
MNISELFQKDINRNINGVIKVGQQDDENIRQELEEYVVTRELDKHFRTFFDRFTDALGNPTDKMGVWISGFFGSGKSHFLKILSYLLENRHLGSSWALDYFNAERIPDPLLLAKITQAAQSSCDVILFNIDSKADANNKHDKESITKVFQKVFDEHLGYFGTIPAIAEFERQLDKQGKYQVFKDAFQAESGLVWSENRDAWGFYQDAIATALQVSTGMSADAANRLLDFNQQNYSLSPEKFAQIVRQYLDGKSPQHRLIFMVDEVGQYIGEDSKLMLNLQTVVEDLGTHCQGKAWVVVTSQEAMDEITKNKIKGEDFSKIIGRFYRPLSLSSANTDEVIKLRLLGKTDAAQTGLEALYNQKVAILRNQITFTQDSADMPGYSSIKDFTAAYPFVPYQFTLLQKVFTQIRLMGSAGKHLASGERSLLDAFQVASQAVAGKPLGVLVPFYTFYMAIEGFLDTAISQVINQATRNPQLQTFDIDLLKTLFMVKYIKEISANLDNLTTLSLGHIDDNKILLKQQVEAALGRLERQTLIQRNGDEYIFLTHEEQDIGREIKNIQADAGKVSKEMQTLVWDSIFTDKELKYGRHRYPFSRQLDEQTSGQQTNDLTLHIVTPYAESYTSMQNDDFCLGITGGGYEVLVRLQDDQSLLDDLNTLVKTDEYLRLKNSSSLTPNIQRILMARRDQNHQRRENIKNTLEDLIAGADVFAYGTKVEIRNRDAKNLLIEGLTYLVTNVYQKLGHVASGFETEEQVTNALTRDSEEKNIAEQAVNAAAHSEMRTWLQDESRAYRQVTIKGLINKFAVRPYGWSQLDTLGVMAELLNQGVVQLRHAQGNVNLREKGLVKTLRSRQGLDTYTVRLADVIDPTSLKVTKDLASDLLNGNIPSDPQLLFESYKKALSARSKQLEEWLVQVQKHGLPFMQLLQTNLDLLGELLTKDGAADLFRSIRTKRDEIEEYIEDVEKLQYFFTGQIKLFQQVRQDLQDLEPELRHVTDPELLKRVESVKQILAMPDPTDKIPELVMLLKPVKEKVQGVLSKRIYQVETKSKELREKVNEYITSAHPEVAEKLDFSSITQQIEQVVSSSSQVTSIDSAIAHEAELQEMLTSLLTQVDQQAEQIIQTQLQSPGDNSTPVVKTKPIVAVQVVKVTTKLVLETPEDVNNYVEALRQELLHQIQQNHKVRLE